jgi:alkylation response protein AidB-like acyl-CoA dehydrogenase
MARYSRFIYEECIKWASLRKAFGKPLTEQPVIRAKLAAMYSKVEAGQAWLEREYRTNSRSKRSDADKQYSAEITYQMCNMTYKEHSEHLAGPVA